MSSTTGLRGLLAGRRPVLLALPAVTVLVAGVVVAVLPRLDSATVLDDRAALEAFRAAQDADPAAATGAGPSPQVAATPTPGAAPAAGPPSPGAGSSTAPGRATAPDPAAAPAGPAAPRVTAGPTPRASPTPSAAEGRQVAPGVYRYATEGFEEVDALGGARHDYPTSSTITYRRSGCGTTERWQPLQERVGENLVCSGQDGSELRATVQQREFFGRSQTERYACRPGTTLLPRDPQPGRTTRGSCRSDDSVVDTTTTVVALETLDVGGTAVPVVHLSIKGTLTGSTRGRADREVWLARADGLLVQVEATTDTDADTEGGTVRYRESYRLRLASLTPRT